MRTNRSTRTLLLALAAGLSLLLTACGSEGTGNTSSAADISTEHNDADIAFIKDMTPHHEGAVMMSELAADRAESPQVKELADRISGAQEPELSLMEDMAAAWGVELGAGGAHGGGHGGMSTDSDSEALMSLDGAEFDRAFLTRMIAHHEGALAMAETEIADGENAQAQQLAQDIVEVQRAEIAEMEQLLTTV